MKILLIILIAALAILLAACVALYVITLKIHDKMFNIRYDKNPLLKYYTADDFSLITEKVSTKCGKVNLNGFIYSAKKEYSTERVIVFCHGLGPGQVAYTTEIATLSSYGYPVVAFDSTGCNLSEGKSMKGIYEYVRCAICATQFAKSRFPKSKIVLVGHSLGGYSALCAASACGVEKVVAISAPATPVKTFTHLVEGQTGKGFAKMVTPFLSLVNIFRFGIKGNTNAAKCASKSNFPVLLIQGKKDVVIDEKNSVYNLAQGSHIKKILREESGHNPYNTVQAEEKLSELSAAMVKSDTPKEFYESFDFALATEEESSLFSEIKTFILG